MALFDLFKPGAVPPIIKSQTDDIDYVWCFDIDYAGKPHTIEVYVDRLGQNERKSFLKSLVVLYDQGGWKRMGKPLTAICRNNFGSGVYEKQISVRWGGNYTLIYQLEDYSHKKVMELMRKYGTISYETVK